METSPQTYFAVIYGEGNNRCGGALDAYPEERVKYMRELKSRIIGEYATAEEAQEVVMKHMRGELRP